MNDREQWLLIFQHHLEEREDLFENKEEVLSCNKPHKLSLLKNIEKQRRYFRINGKFYFKLEYPGIEGIISV